MSKTEPTTPPETMNKNADLPPRVPGGTDYLGKGAKPETEKR